MTAPLIIFFVLAALSIIGAVSLIFQKHPIHSALSLIVVMVALAGLYLLMGAEFVAAVQDERVHPEDGQVHRTRAVHAGAGRGHLFQHDRRLGDAPAATAVALRHGDTDPAARTRRISASSRWMSIGFDT